MYITCGGQYVDIDTVTNTDGHIQNSTQKKTAASKTSLCKEQRSSRGYEHLLSRAVRLTCQWRTSHLFSGLLHYHSHRHVCCTIKGTRELLCYHNRGTERDNVFTQSAGRPLSRLGDNSRVKFFLCRHQRQIETDTDTDRHIHTHTQIDIDTYIYIHIHRQTRYMPKTTHCCFGWNCVMRMRKTPCV